MCVSLAIAVMGHETCSAAGTWGTCDCQAEPEPECSTASCTDQCSATMRAAVHALPNGGSEADCRAAFIEVQQCVGDFCDATPFTDGSCSAELTALDQACLGKGDPCPATQ
jgi:hypothetical protein